VNRRATPFVLVTALALAGCTREATGSATTFTSATATAPTTEPAVTAASLAPVTTPRPGAVTAAPAPASPPTTPAPTAPPTTAVQVGPATTTVAVAVDDVAYVVPVVNVDAAGWSPDHAGYPATDVFLPCGATVVSPVDGTLLEVRRADEWDPAVDDPATRGGRSIAILGADGVRYYLAHFDTILDGLEPGVRVAAGAELGSLGRTGRTSACHLHVGISPPCPTAEWWVRRGVVWPHPYLDAWRTGEQRSPVDEVAAWSADHPDACTTPP
jgi:murein DD-endopeptidase MepM/ murein hydrolase activator NlpD